MGDKPILTIAVPTYNRVGKLEACLNSVFSQDGLDKIEILVSDNASTDGTRDFMERLVSGHSEVSYRRNDANLGPDGNFIKCYEAARGEYTMLLSDDDMLLPGALDTILETLASSPDFVHLASAPNPVQDGVIAFSSPDAIFEEMGIWITFVSSLICKTSLIKADDGLERYAGTYFLQSHVALRVINAGTLFVEIKRPCIDATPNESLSYDLYHVWGRRFHELMVDEAVACGVDAEVSRCVYEKAMRDHVLFFVYDFRRKDAKSREWEGSEMECCFPDLPLGLQRDFRFAMTAPPLLARGVFGVRRRIRAFVGGIARRSHAG